MSPSPRAYAPAELRKTILGMAYRASAIHIACAFSLVEILAVLYREHLQFGGGAGDPQRDYLILSKGHGVMAQYACLHELGWLTTEHIHQYCADGALLKGLSEAMVPGLEVNSGSLGHGLAVGAGLAYGALRRGTNQKIYAIVGDGECNEGSIWESLLFAAHFRLTNFCVVVDANGYQALGRTAEIMNLGDLEQKFTAFGFETCTINGHDEILLHAAFSRFARSTFPGPRAIIARTVKGKGVSFMEGSNLWHYRRLTPTLYEQAMAELSEADSNLKAERGAHT
jgi:transketolase